MNQYPDSLSGRLAAAIAWSRAAGQITLNHFQQQALDVERKADNSPVTIADRRAEEFLRARIGESFPRDGVCGEEFGEHAGTSPFTWIVDPIDGTKTFIGGVPLYSQLIGIVEGRRSVAGVIAIPALDEMVFAAKGQGAWWCRRSIPAQRARVSRREKLSEGFFVTSQVDTFGKRGAAGAYDRLQKAAYITRTWGDAYGYLLVATGRAEVMVDPVMNVWDAAAIQPILEEAGGTFTDWSGSATIHSGEGVGTNGHVLDEVLAVTRDFPKPS